jgi:hypothetical protein
VPRHHRGAPRAGTLNSGRAFGSADAFSCTFSSIRPRFAAALGRRRSSKHFFAQERRISSRAPHAPEAMGDVARTDETLEFGGVVNPAALVFGTSITGFSLTSTTRATTSRSDGTLSMSLTLFPFFASNRLRRHAGGHHGALLRG